MLFQPCQNSRKTARLWACSNTMQVAICLHIHKHVLKLYAFWLRWILAIADTMRHFPICHLPYRRFQITLFFKCKINRGSDSEYTRERVAEQRSKTKHINGLSFSFYEESWVSLRVTFIAELFFLESKVNILYLCSSLGQFLSGSSGL